MSRTPLQLYIDCVYHNESTSRWPSWRHFVCCMVLHHRTWMILFVSPTCPVVADFTRRHHINCLFHHSGSQPSVDAHFQSLHRSCATHCHLTNNHPRLCSSSANVSKHSFHQSFPNIVLWLNCAFMDFITLLYLQLSGSLAEWLARWTHAQKGPGSNRSRNDVGWQS